MTRATTLLSISTVSILTPTAEILFVCIFIHMGFVRSWRSGFRVRRYVEIWLLLDSGYFKQPICFKDTENFKLIFMSFRYHKLSCRTLNSTLQRRIIVAELLYETGNLVDFESRFIHQRHKLHFATGNVFHHVFDFGIERGASSQARHDESMAKGWSHSLHIPRN